MLTAATPTADQLLAALPVATLLVDADGLVARANAAAEQLLNRSERTMIGRPLARVLTLPAGIDRDGVAAFDASVALAQGGTLRADVSVAPLADHPGWRAVVLHPVAPARRLGHSAARSAIGAAAMLAHEIKNPLSGIRGAAQLIADGAPAPELTGLVIAEVDRVTALIDRMEDFTDTRPLACEPLNIYPLLAHARGVARSGFASAVAIDERFDPSLPPVLANRDALLQILINLLKNAAEATGPGGRITLVTRYRHGMALADRNGDARRPLPIEIAVHDDGPGAPDDIADHLFDPFVSGHPEGKGLGLALVDKLVRDMRGIVEYAREGTPPQTVFRLLLPRGA